MIVAGFGFSSRATVDSLADALTRATEHHRPDAFAAPADKTDLLRILARAQNTKVLPVSASALEAQTTRTASDRSQQARNTGSVAEAAALAAAGPGATLIEARVVSSDNLATCALAQGKIT